ncbi:MAG: hypothetical protein J6N21_07975, partial [Butyrivibrio sp.]|nr:hypothetical protein [Butyrivibrio sp.]
MQNYNKYKKYKAVSFDMYNTLIVRNVSRANNVFEMTDEYYTLTEKKVGIIDYKRKRINAEKNAVERHGRTVGLDTIFDCLSESEEASVCEKYKEIEKSIEVDIACANREVKEIYD